MATILSVHSFRGGTGKSNTTANLAVIYALRGKRVGVIDTDIQSPGIHVLFDVAGDDVTASLNDFLWHGRDIADVAQELQVPRVRIAVNKVPDGLDHDAVAARVTEAYGCPVAAVLPHSDELMRLASEGIFVARYPDHELSALYAQIASSLIDDAA